MEKEKTALGEYITALMEERSLNEIGVSHMMKISPKQLIDLITGETEPNESTFSKLEYVFCISHKIFKSMVE